MKASINWAGGSMAESSGPTLQRRRLGYVLRRLREESQLTGKQVGDAVERSSSWISRVESGRVGLRVRDLRELCELYGLTDEQRLSELEALARGSKQRGWWSQYTDVLPEGYAMYIGLEDEAKSLMFYSNTVVPGLLQTAAYANALYSTYIPPRYPLHDKRVSEARIEVRIRRQQILRRDPAPSVVAVLDQAILHRHYGGRNILREQLVSLAELTKAGSLKLHILPFDRVNIATLSHSFTLLEFDDGPSLIYIETFGENIIFQDENPVAIHRQAFANLETVSLTEEESLQRLDSEIKNLA